MEKLNSDDGLFAWHLSGGLVNEITGIQCKSRVSVIFFAL